MKEEVLASELFSIGAIKFGEFRLKLHEKHPDAPLSPIYVDLRVLRSFPDVLDLAVNAYLALTIPLQFSCYADIPTAATPIVAVMSNKTRVPMITPRMSDKTHGLKGKIDGVFVSGQIVLLVDDLITTAGSKLEAISILEEHGLIIGDVVVLVDREQGGAEELHKQGVNCHTVFKLSELLSHYVKTRLIDSGTHKRVIDYLRK